LAYIAASSTSSMTTGRTRFAWARWFSTAWASFSYTRSQPESFTAAIISTPWATELRATTGACAARVGELATNAQSGSATGGPSSRSPFANRATKTSSLGIRQPKVGRGDEVPTIGLLCTPAALTSESRQLLAAQLSEGRFSCASTCSRLVARARESGEIVQRSRSCQDLPGLSHRGAPVRVDGAGQCSGYRIGTSAASLLF